MPLAALTLLNAAMGFALALFAARELRASPRSVTGLRSFAALGMHEAMVVVPAVFYLLVRHTDWMLSYATDGSRVPSAALLIVGGLQGLVALVGFATGARWMRDHHLRWTVVTAATLGALALGLLVVFRARVGVVGTTGQYRGGFGMVPFWSSRVSTAVMVVAMAQVGGYAHLAWRVRDHVTR